MGLTPDGQVFVQEIFLERNRLRLKRARGKRARTKACAYVDAIKRFLGCTDCGYDKDPKALHFDHVRGKKYKGISELCSKGYSLTAIKKEIQKCEVRCANCHSSVTHKRLQQKD